MDFERLKKQLDKKVEEYNQPEFIHDDPIQIPHSFSRKEDREIAGFLTATIAWGQRKSIIKNAQRLMDIMYNSPYWFVTSDISGEDKTALKQFVHRTFNGDDCLFFVESLRNIYLNHGGLEAVFTEGYKKDNTIFSALEHFRNVFLSVPHQKRSEKHISDVTSGSGAKRLNMFLRWMVRDNETGVDFGLWKNIPASALMLPLDVHTGNVGREWGLLQRKQNNWKAVEEITGILRKFDPNDPVKYDFALFGTGVNK